MPIIVWGNSGNEAFSLPMQQLTPTNPAIGQLLGWDTVNQVLNYSGIAYNWTTFVTSVPAGIQFPVIKVPSTGVNVLDDYEEGVWVPSIGGTATYTTQVGTYTKIGRLVTFTIDLAINVLGTGSTSLISGLPFPAAASPANQAVPVAFWSSLAVTPVQLIALIAASASALTLTGATAAAATLTTQAALGNGARVVLSGSYITTT